MEKKAKALWADKRKYSERALLSGATILAACFTFIFFGPFEMVAFGKDSFIFTYKDVFWLLLSATAAVFALGTLVVSLLRGKIYNYVIAIIFSITLSGYLQASFLNGSVGALTGEAVEWSKMKPEMAISLAVWLAVFVMTITVLYFHRTFWKNLVIGVSSMLVLMQLAPLVGILLGAFEEARIPEGSQYYLSNEGLNEFSADENVFVFILDYMDYDYVEAIYNREPSFFDDFDGFTGYTDAISMFGRTRPSVCNILTGYHDGAYCIANEEFMQKAWESQPSNLLNVLKEKEYSIELYASLRDIFGSAETAIEYVSNVDQKDNSGSAVIPGMMLKKLLYLSVYRYAPTALKPFFWEYTSFYNDGVADTTIYKSDDLSVCGLLSEGSANRSEKCFKLYHMDGAHPPCYLNRNGEYMGPQTNEYEQSMGCLTLMKNVFSQMKSLGIYEDATIIMSADHGDASKLWLEDFPGMQIALFYKPSGSAETPFLWSDSQVSTSNIPATIAKAVGAEYDQFGLALDDVNHQNYERIFYRVYGEGEESSEVLYDRYTVTGKAEDIANWTIEDTKKVLYPFS